MNLLIDAITSTEPRGPRPLARSLCARRWRRGAARRTATRSTASAAPATTSIDRVRALFFLYAIHRFHIPRQLGAGAPVADSLFGATPTSCSRRFEEAIETLLGRAGGARPERRHSRAPSPPPTALSASRRSPTRCAAASAPSAAISGCSAPDTPPTTRCASGPSLLQRASDGAFPILREATPVRMDLTHSGWSDIFFLGMDFPRARASLNISVDLAVRGVRDRRAPSRPSRPTSASSTSRCCVSPASICRPPPTSPPSPRSSTSRAIISAC